MPGDINILHLCTPNDNHMMYGSWNMECNRHNFLSFWFIFCPFKSLTTQKINILKKWKKPWRYYHFTHVYHTVNENHVMCGLWNMKRNRQNFFVILGHFLPFYPADNPENQKFEKMEKNTWRYHHFTQVYQKSWLYGMLYCSWDIARDGCNFYFLFWAIFYPFTPLPAWKSKFFKNEKNAWRYHQFSHVYHKLWSDNVWFLRYSAWQMDGWKKWHI